MADPISISGGVVGVVSLGLTVCQGLIAYYGPWKSYDDEISGFTTRLEGLQHSLQVLHEFISPEQELDLPSDQYKKIVSLQLKSCEDACQKLGVMLDKCKSTEISPFVRKHDWLRLKRALYPFKKETLVTLSQYVSGLQDNLNLSLQLLNGALITQQQKQIQNMASTATAIGVQTTRILTVVEQSNTMSPSPQTMVHQRTARGEPGIRPILEPRTLNHLCNQKTLINSSWMGPRSLQTRSSHTGLTEKYCTCKRRPRYSPRFSLSVSAGHKAGCPLYVDGHTTMGISARYTFCNRLLGMSVHFMMTLTRGTGALAISPTLQFHSVVCYSSPVFRLLREMVHYPYNEPKTTEVLWSTQKSILKMFHDRKAAPTDRLADGTTILHELLFPTYNRLRFSQELRVLHAVPDVVYALIDAGVPVAEQNLAGDSVADVVINEMLRGASWDAGILIRANELLHRLFMSGSELGSLTRAFNPYNPYDEEDPEWLYQKMAILQRLHLEDRLEDIQLSPLEIAIVTKSEERLRYCLSGIGSSDDLTHTLGFRTLLAWCLGWVPGVLLVLKSPLPRDADSITDCFVGACRTKQIESALLLLQYRPLMRLCGLKAAVRCGDITFSKTIISTLAAQRRELLELALCYLPAAVIRELKLPESGLLDTKALAVYDALVRQGIEPFPCAFGDGKSVYGAIGADVLAAELLYETGFTDLNQRGDRGNTPISGICGAGFYTLPSFVTLADWAICRGAGLYVPSRDSYPAVFDIADTLGSMLHVGSCTCHSEQFPHHLTSECILGKIMSAHVSVVRLLSIMFSDRTRDDCLCACSQYSCSPLTRLLKSYYWPRGSYTRMDQSLFYIVSHFQKIICQVSNPSNTDYSEKTVVSAIVRYLAFEALEMTHTCHNASHFGAGIQDQGDICKIRDEESLLIVQLDTLMVEFDRMYEEFGVGIREFLERYWGPRMNGVLEEQDFDYDEVIKVRESGVIVSCEDDSF